MLRRLVALVLMLCFGLFTAEALMADVHDGDATHEELVRVDGDRHVEQHAAAATDGDHTPREPASGEPAHSEHACHCVHTHGAWLPMHAALTTATVIVASRQPAQRADRPASPALESHLRPPIA